ncbi:hypothetical protein CGZ90_15890 [Fictibacillus aquaticus]|uniref:Uncharacterized protein n=2 Tax=Fictibacillus TaxID=1329200 RepID=A0A235F5J2_9BACL|nr:hypothetical protein CGZ90_15890 [Fictibacillus aquaticus]
MWGTVPDLSFGTVPHAHEYTMQVYNQPGRGIDSVILAGGVCHMINYYEVIEKYIELIRKRHWRGELAAKQYKRKLELIHLWLIRDSVQSYARFKK